MGNTSNHERLRIVFVSKKRLKDIRNNGKCVPHSNHPCRKKILNAEIPSKAIETLLCDKFIPERIRQISVAMPRIPIGE